MSSPGSPLAVNTTTNVLDSTTLTAKGTTDTSQSSTVTTTPTTVTTTAANTTASITVTTGSTTTVSGGLPVGAKIGIGVGVPVAVIIVSVLAFLLLKRRGVCKGKKPKPAPSLDMIMEAEKETNSHQNREGPVMPLPQRDINQSHPSHPRHTFTPIPTPDEENIAKMKKNKDYVNQEVIDALARIKSHEATDADFAYLATLEDINKNADIMDSLKESDYLPMDKEKEYDNQEVIAMLRRVNEDYINKDIIKKYSARENKNTADKSKSNRNATASAQIPERNSEYYMNMTSQNGNVDASIDTPGEPQETYENMLISNNSDPNLPQVPDRKAR